MYLWMAADLGNALEAAREKALAENRRIGLSEVAFTLPAHVSLKISFPADDKIWQDIARQAEQIFCVCPAFDIRVKGLERRGDCLWIAMEENTILKGLHEKMTALARKAGAPLHPFDADFLYHSTLFLSPDAENMEKMEDKLKDLPLPEVIPVQGFLIGGSESGKPGEYRVYKRIPAMK